MQQGQLHTFLRRLQQLTNRRLEGGLSDAELLERFATHHDEAAFEVIVWRHGPMVLNLCRGLLRHTQDVEDAFQATFLALVRKAKAIRKSASLGSWLYKVAQRIALEAKLRAVSRGRREATGELEAVAATVPDGELRRILDEEVQRLPEKYRQAVILCYLAGKTTAEAAACLGCARGTILSRLAWARQRLQLRLTKRGVAPAAGGVTLLLAASASSAVVPVVLVRKTVRAALCFAVGHFTAAGIVSEQAVQLMERGLYAMFLNKLKVTTAIAAALMVGLGGGLLAYRPVAADPIERPRADKTRQIDAPRVVAERKPEAAPTLTSEPVPERPTTVKMVEVERPVGIWERKVGPYQIVLRVEADHLTAKFSGQEEKVTYIYTVDADYSVTKDHLLYGIVTGAEANVPSADDMTAGALARYTDYTFSVRYRVDGDALTIKDFKMGIPDNSKDMDKEVLMFMGKYKKRTGRDKD